MQTETIRYFTECQGELFEGLGPCPKCGGVHSVRTIRYTHSKKPHGCNAKCMSATGPNCECSCGGRNHGAGFVPSMDLFEMEPAWGLK